MAPTWEELELPVLQWAQRDGDSGSDRLWHNSTEPFAGAPQVTQVQADEALSRLDEYGLIAGRDRRVETSDFAEWPRVRPTANGLRVLGEWPPEKDAAVHQALVAVLRNVADDLLDEDEAGAVRRAAGSLDRFGAGVVGDVAQDELKSIGGDIAS
ncbi:MAG: hypothetical protein M3Z33_11155 [Actinomycetota bacterium]|nr:hypothetical protein [Actinomycetota bacterium]